MKIYRLNPDKSKVRWSSAIGDKEIRGVANIEDGHMISEMGKIIEGNISVDLKSLSISDTSLSKDQRKLLAKAMKSSKQMEDVQTLANFKFEEVISNEDHELIKGILMIGNLAFGLNVKSKFNETGDDLITKGDFQIQKSNFSLIEELENVFQEKIESEKSIDSFNVEYELFASVSQ